MLQQTFWYKREAAFVNSHWTFLKMFSKSNWEFGTFILNKAGFANRKACCNFLKHILSRKILCDCKIVRNYHKFPGPIFVLMWGFSIKPILYEPYIGTWALYKTTYFKPVPLKLCIAISESSFILPWSTPGHAKPTDLSHSLKRVSEWSRNSFSLLFSITYLWRSTSQALHL